MTDRAGKMITRRGLLGGLMAGISAGGLRPAMAGGIAQAPPPRPMRGGGNGAGNGAGAAPAADDSGALVAAAALSGTVAWVVADLATGRVLDARGGGAPLPPASATKALTSLYALDRLGAARRLTSRVLASGPMRGGVVQGDIVLAGGGDPTLQTDQLGDLVARLAQSGLRGATGRLLYWEGALPQIERIVRDQPDQVGYNPAISGLNLNFNRVHFAWKRSGSGWAVGMDARGARFVPPVQSVGVSVVSREAPVFTYRRESTRESWTVAAAALGKEGSRWLPVRLPGLYLAGVFRALAAAQGIALPPPEAVRDLPAGLAELGRVDSDPLRDMLRGMLRYSTNITAECLGLAASGAGGLEGSAAAMAGWIARSFGTPVTLADHSGLGGATRVTAEGMVRILRQAEAEGRGLKPLLHDAGMRDDAGKAIKGHAVRVPAKSGTLNFVSALAGYIVPPSGRELVFAILTGDPDRRDAVPLSEREMAPGSKAWVGRSRRLQGQLISRWAARYC